MYHPGDLVLFTPKNLEYADFAGKRIVKQVTFDGLIQLECGNIVLLAMADELTKL